MRSSGENRFDNGGARSYNNRNDREGGFRERNNGGSGGYSRGGGGDRYNSGGYSGRDSGGFGRSGPKRDDLNNTKLDTVDWSNEKMGKLEKNFYKEHSDVSVRDSYEIDKWHTDNQVTLQGTGIPKPVFEFNELPIEKDLLSILNTNFQKPTTIQAISWPIAMSGRDIISIARTGSGKTLGFMIPAINHILNQPQRRNGDGPVALVLLPTRELAQQVEQVSKEYCRAMNLSLCCVFGGAPKNPQIRDLSRGVDIVIATPGRLLDFLTNRSTNLRRASFLVLDEADRMLDMGFEPQIRQIVGQIRPDRQTMMFSATWPKEVRNMAMEFQSNPAHLTVGSLELAANHNITQHIEFVEEHDKKARLIELLGTILEDKTQKCIIFVETKRKADEITRELRRDGWPMMCIHGDKGQGERDWVLRQFKEGKTPVLMATDVAARGLDVSDVKCVVNYDYPNNTEDYVHRIGRTGRAGNTGSAYTFFTSSNSGKSRDLLKILEEAKQQIPDRIRDMARSSRGGNGNGRGFKRPYGGGGYNSNGYSNDKRPRYNNGGGRSRDY